MFSNWIGSNLIWITVAITILALVYFIYGIIQTLRKKHRFVSQLNIILLILGLIFLIFLTYHANEIKGTDWGQLIVTLGLVVITALYASSTEKQAVANVKMAEEMREQTIITSRPLIIQKAIRTTSIPDHFEIYNAGHGTAIEVQVSLQLKREPPYSPIDGGERVGFLRADDDPFLFYPTYPPDVINSTFYLVSEYQGILSHRPQPTWYQTWLPCKLAKSGAVISGELEFYKVDSVRRIGLFKV